MSCICPSRSRIFVASRDLKFRARTSNRDSTSARRCCPRVRLFCAASSSSVSLSSSIFRERSRLFVPFVDIRFCVAACAARASSTSVCNSLNCRPSRRFIAHSVSSICASKFARAFWATPCAARASKRSASNTLICREVAMEDAFASRALPDSAASSRSSSVRRTRSALSFLALAPSTARMSARSCSSSTKRARSMLVDRKCTSAACKLANSRSISAMRWCSLRRVPSRNPESSRSSSTILARSPPPLVSASLASRSSRSSSVMCKLSALVLRLLASSACRRPASATEALFSVSRTSWRSSRSSRCSAATFCKDSSSCLRRTAAC
mmetsp:Transcript_49894/g.132561  ORF Transcript_49894/g.132561 Transcript_49894/m.132561 type:complete len:325 (+) Transcript_49894:939-1913(+)